MCGARHKAKKELPERGALCVGSVIPVDDHVPAGLAEGDLRRLIKQTCKKMQTLLSAEEIADDLAEDDVALIQKIMDAAKEFAPEYDIDAIYEKVAK